MSKSLKIKIYAIVGIFIFCIAVYSLREYWADSFLIYTISSAKDRRNLDATPEEYQVEDIERKTCTIHTAYGYNLCLPWNDVEDKYTSDVISSVHFKRDAVLVIHNPDFEGNRRSELVQTFFENDIKGYFEDINEEDAHDLISIVETTLDTSNYNYLKKTLNATYSDYSFFTPYKEVFPKFLMLMSKLRVCRFGANSYAEKILSLDSINIKGFQIIFPEKEEARIIQLYLFPNEKENIKITVVSKLKTLKQNDIDWLISTIGKIE